MELDFETATAEDIYTVISSVTGLPKTRLRITKGSDGSLIATKRDDGKPIALEETGLRNASQVFVKDLGRPRYAPPAGSS